MWHSWAICTGSFIQLEPPSRERKSAAGLIPTKIVWVSIGSMAMDQIGMPSMGDHIFSHFVDAKTIEFDDYRVTVHEWELAQYLAEY